MTLTCIMVKLNARNCLRWSQRTYIPNFNSHIRTTELSVIAIYTQIASGHILLASDTISQPVSIYENGWGAVASPRGANGATCPPPNLRSDTQ